MGYNPLMGNFYESNKLNLLLGINIAIFILGLIIQFIFRGGFDESLFLLFGGFSSIEVSKGSLWLLTTANFFHIDIVHFAFNMYSLSRVGQIVRTFYGDSKLFTTYIVGGLASTIITLLAVEVFDLVPMLSLGASGSVFALLGLLIGGTVKRNRYGVSLPFELKDFYLPLLLTFSLALIPDLRVNHWAHFGGLLCGIILGFIFENSIGNIESKEKREISKLLYKFSILVLLLSYVALMLNFVNEIFL